MTHNTSGSDRELTDGNHLEPVLVARWVLEDAAQWLGHVEDWLLHAHPEHAYEFADFLGHCRRGHDDYAAAGLLGTIGSIAYTLDRLLAEDRGPQTETDPDTKTETEKRTR